MNRLSLRNNRLKFKSSGKLLIILDESKEMKKYQNITTYNRRDLETLGFWPFMPKNFPAPCSKPRRPSGLYWHLRINSILWDHKSLEIDFDTNWKGSQSFSDKFIKQYKRLYRMYLHFVCFSLWVTSGLGNWHNNLLNNHCIMFGHVLKIVTDFQGVQATPAAQPRLKNSLRFHQS